VLTRTVGYQLTKAQAPGTAAAPAAKPRSTAPAPRLAAGDRLVPAPVFLLSSVRSGSTLTRVILDTHSQIHAPHELHLRVVRVKIERGFGQLSMQHLGLDERGLEHLLWDRVLHRSLSASGKRVIVDKTPNNVFMWKRLPQAWPDAKFIFLLRHPAAIADSLYRATKEPVTEQVVARVLEYATALEEARQNLPGLTVRYEELVAAPEAVTRGICEYLDVPWEPSMLDYGSVEHGPFVNRLGDWSDKIRSGQIHSDVELPAAEDVPTELREMSRAWGYLEAEVG
jgi:hypothetical protein